MHSVLPALDKCSERVAAPDEKLPGECCLAIRQIPPQTEETLGMRRQASSNCRMGELTFKERPFPRLHCLKAQLPRCTHAALAHAAGAIAVPIRCKHQRRGGSGPFVLSQGAHCEFR